MRGRHDIDAIRAALADPFDVCHRLGLEQGAKRQGAGLSVLCPAHGERTASCSVTRGPDRTLRVRCFGCDLAGDVFDLVAAVERLDRRRDFGAVLRRAAELAGVDIERAAIEHALRAPPPPPPPKPPPPAGDVTAFWRSCRPCSSDPGVVAWLRSRGFDVSIVERLDLVRALPAGAPCPAWARYRGARDAAVPWSKDGYRAIVPMFNAAGELRSVRARCIDTSRGNDAPKALPPSGYGTKGLVMACPLGSMMLACGGWPWWAKRQVVICEGEPDFITWATHEPIPRTFAVLAIGGAGQWNDDIADRIPDNSTVLLRTDRDDAGDAYALEIAASLCGRCNVKESDGEGRAARRQARLEQKSERQRQGPEQGRLWSVQ
jgi:hypothetical protein